MKIINVVLGGFALTSALNAANAGNYINSAIQGYSRINDISFTCVVKNQDGGIVRKQYCSFDLVNNKSLVTDVEVIPSEKADSDKFIHVETRSANGETESIVTANFAYEDNFQLKPFPSKSDCSIVKQRNLDQAHAVISPYFVTRNELLFNFIKTTPIVLEDAGNDVISASVGSNVKLVLNKDGEILSKEIADKSKKISIIYNFRKTYKSLGYCVPLEVEAVIVTPVIKQREVYYVDESSIKINEPGSSFKRNFKIPYGANVINNMTGQRYTEMSTPTKDEVLQLQKQLDGLINDSGER